MAERKIYLHGKRPLMLRCAVWDSFFLDEPMPGADFMEARAAQVQDERESL